MLELTQKERDIIVARLKEIKDDNRLKLKKMGAIMGVSEATASRYLSGDVDNIPLPRIKALCREYGLNPAWALGLSEKKFIYGKEE
ncbi:MAG: helix-turn-helix transcriptional regulator [Eubacteriales bacterium]|nr:helix-turn-helix transcriptional regulator [Eubacteriales bacterium]